MEFQTRRQAEQVWNVSLFFQWFVGERGCDGDTFKDFIGWMVGRSVGWFPECVFCHLGQAAVKASCYKGKRMAMSWFKDGMPKSEVTI